MNKFSPYRPGYSLVENVNRTGVLLGASTKAIACRICLVIAILLNRVLAKLGVQQPTRAM